MDAVDAFVSLCTTAGEAIRMRDQACQNLTAVLALGTTPAGDLDNLMHAVLVTTVYAAPWSELVHAMMNLGSRDGLAATRASLTERLAATPEREAKQCGWKLFLTDTAHFDIDPDPTVDH